MEFKVYWGFKQGETVGAFFIDAKDLKQATRKAKKKIADNPLMFGDGKIHWVVAVEELSQ